MVSLASSSSQYQLSHYSGLTQYNYRLDRNYGWCSAGDCQHASSTHYEHGCKRYVLYLTGCPVRVVRVLKLLILGQNASVILASSEILDKSHVQETTWSTRGGVIAWPEQNTPDSTLGETTLIARLAERYFYRFPDRTSLDLLTEHLF